MLYVSGLHTAAKPWMAFANSHSAIYVATCSYCYNDERAFISKNCTDKTHEFYVCGLIGLLSEGHFANLVV